MISFLKVFDGYSIRARLFPAAIAIAPALAALALLVSWKSLEVSNIVATLAVLVLMFALADFTRARGRAIEKKLYLDHGGMPSITMFRRNDSTINEGTKQRYRELLAERLSVPVPTPDVERADQGTADAFYEQCGIWLRQNTRDVKKFSLLFNENVTYGFRRNLLGVKWIALSLNLAVVGCCLAFLWDTGWSWNSASGKRTTVVLIIAAIHAAYIFFAVQKLTVVDASRAYARELILSSEAFASKAKTTATNRPKRKPNAKT